MNVPAAIIAAGLGGLFFTAELVFYFQPSWINSDYIMGVVFASNHSKARVAVQRLLVDPTSAKFGELQTVEAEKAKFVCGAVKAKDRAGYYSEYRNFVYTVSTNSARIDDDGWIAEKHAAFKVCPVTPEDQQKISPDAVSMAKVIEKAVPAAANSALSTMASNMPAGSGSSPGGSLEQQVGHMANQMTGGPLPASPPGPAGLPGSGASSGSSGQAGSTFMAALANESEWRSDRTPVAWPTFPLGHPLTKWAPKRSTGLAFALAKDIEDRWEQSKRSNAKGRPSADEIQEACRALLTIDPKDSEFPNAWAAFVRLRKIDREAGS